ncbi:ATP-binding protein [Streptosporangium sp. NBC_01755]|uniref:FtsK/SpoIIIE domain-containing protein n=1 Tax=Streptosporangium sp. NBC_01755 TaxID=2975949 RepID=UPI002DDB2323|nr:FtsK/SpoIIIE domain-containing protein [Streptosporangium sp. NBC_01755]WSD03217.1 ATP-binding protein [Streptosporangium sp. NBC_01755]
MSESQRPYLHIVRDAADAPPLPGAEHSTDLEPTTQHSAKLEQQVFEGEIVDDEPTPRYLPVRIAGRAVAVQPSPAVRQAAQVTAVAAFTVAQGWHSWAVRAADGLTFGVYRRQIRAAEAMGDREALAEWIDRKERAVHQRHARLMDLPRVALNVAKMLGISLVGALVLLLALSTAMWATGVADFGAVWMVAGGALRLLLTILKYTWFLLPLWMLVGAWREGRRRGARPQWMTPAREREAESVVITPSIVVVALRDLGISPLRKAIQDMGDAGAAMLGPIRIAGCGVEVDVMLPSGVSTEEVEKKRRKLAENLGRHEHELFITKPEAARTVRLWIADSGALDEPIGPSPLVTDAGMRASYASDRAPWGQDLRGDAARISLHQRHLLITGLSNQGKTAAMRALALWLAFDSRVEFRIADLKGVGDWAMFNDLATVLIQGPTDDHVVAATKMVEAGVAEMERRLLAPPGSKFDPLILMVDEAQVAFMCPEKDDAGNPYGGTKATSRYFRAVRKIHNQGRAVDVTLWQGTQDPTDQNLPKLVREGAHIRASLVVGSEEQARMALGDKAIDGGAAPHKLRQGLDKGTVVVAGDGVEMAPGQASITIRTHYVSTEDAAKVAARAKARRAKVTTRSSAAVEEARDLLADLDEVLDADGERIKLSDVPALLRDLAPGWPGYAGLTGVRLREVLTQKHGVRVINKGNVLLLDPADVRRAMAGREASE